ncbi:hypothetical protein L218DRAFT_656281 [Marasmius fiardii PR-910]|nr:hypothetical protein L218DRAFT_656281 [Marasmius fiardii PR-910]
MHNKCSRSKCTYPNPPQCASGTYTCAGCQKGTYFITPAMAESAVVLKQRVYKFEAENRKKMKVREEEAEQVREMRDLKRYEIEWETDRIQREEEIRREMEFRLKEEKKTMVIRRQEQAKKKREEQERREVGRRMWEYETQFAVYEPSIASSIDYVGETKRKVSLSEFPMPPTHDLHRQYLNHKLSSCSINKNEVHRRQQTSRDHLRSKSTPSLRRAPPRQGIPEEYHPYPDAYAYAY